MLNLVINNELACHQSCRHYASRPETGEETFKPCLLGQSSQSEHHTSLGTVSLINLNIN